MQVYYRGQRLTYRELAQPRPRKCEVDDRTKHSVAVRLFAKQAESRSFLATRLPKTDLLETAAAHCRKHGSFAVNSCCTRNTKAKAGDAIGRPSFSSSL